MTALLEIPVAAKEKLDVSPNENVAAIGGMESDRRVRFEYSENLPSILADLNCSLLVSTYKTGNLVCIAGNHNRLTPSFHSFERPMGLAVNDNGIAVGAKSQIWFLRSAPEIAARYQPLGRHDASYLTRYSHFTGDIHGHEIAWAGKELWIVNTLFSCLCSLHPSYNFAPRWRPLFITALVPEDRCHLNGLAVADGQPRFVSAMAETNSRQGWRPVKNSGGCVIDVPSGTTITRGLTMPHSPRIANGKLFVLHSGLGRLETVEPSSGLREVVCELPGYARGLAIHGSTAFIGLSKIRASSAWQGVPIAADPGRLKCGVWAVDLDSGKTVAQFEFTSTVEELFDVQVLAGVRSPLLSGPMAELDSGQPLWTMMPSK